MIGLVNEIWQVQIFRGAEISVSDGPVKLGTPEIGIGGPEGVTQARVPLVYGPVGVRTVGEWGCIEASEPKTQQAMEEELAANGYASGGPRILRTMDPITSFEFGSFGEITLSGMEARNDGALVRVSWEITPYVEG
jgi:hypothetical protein